MSDAPQAADAPVTVTLAHADGLHRNPSLADLSRHVTEGRYVWLDICGPAAHVDTAMLRELGLDIADLEWIQRFGQVARMSIGRHGIRAVSWLAAPPEGLIELHVWASTKGAVTLWQGEPRLLEEAREEFADRVAGVSGSPYHGAAILLQLLLGPLDHVINFVDERIHAVHDQIRDHPGSMDFTQLSRRLELLRDFWLKYDRYSAAVRSATVGIEAIPSIDADGIRELNEYAERVEDTENRLHQRFQWGADIMQDYATTLAQRQGEQINRLAVVSMIFLPISFLTGYFGMNFSWMADRLGGGPVFLVLGVLVPLACAGLTSLWLKRKALL
jgi:magnesium transporter